jgi:pyruvate,water dikinase
MQDATKFIRWFDDIGLNDVPLVGGKNASLGELFRELTRSGIRVPEGFAITTDAYRHFMNATGLATKISAMLQGLDTSNLADLAKRGRAIRESILEAELPADPAGGDCRCLQAAGR